MSAAQRPLPIAPTASPIPESILEIATKLFWQKGFAATTTRQIAAAAGMKQASLYYHVTSKEDLIYFIFVSSLRDLTGRVERELQKEANPLERIRRLMSAHLQGLLRHQTRNSVMLTEILLISGARGVEIRAMQDHYTQLVSSAIENAQLSGAIRKDIPAGHLALALLNLLNWTSLWFQPTGNITVPALATQYTRLFLLGASTMAGRKHVLKLVELPRRKRQLRPDSGPTQRRLHEVAANLFARRGYEVTSMQDIAEALGVRKASLYYHVRSKEDLLFAIASAALETITADVENALEDVAHPLDRVAVLIQAHLRSLVTHREMHMAGRSGMRALSATRRASVQALRDAHEHLVSKVLGQAQASGHIRKDIEAKILRLALLSMMNRSEIWYRPGGQLTAERISALISSVFLHGAGQAPPGDFKL